MDQRPSGQNQDISSDKDVRGEIASEEPLETSSAEAPIRPRRRRSRTVGCLLALLGALAGGALAWWWIASDTVADHEAAEDAGVAGPADEATPPANRLIFSPTPGRPEQTPDIISAETEVIYAFYDLDQLPADAPLTAQWSHEGEPLGDLPLSEHQWEADSEHARGRFALHPPAADPNAAAAQPDAAGFFPGIYEIELTSPDYPDISTAGSFVALPRAAQILQGGGEPEGPPVIRSLRTASGVTEEGEPVNPTSSFPAEIERITAVFTYRGIAPGSVLTVRWHGGEQELTTARSEIPIVAAEGWAEAWLEAAQEQRLPAGSYYVSVHHGEDDQPLASTGFEIEAPDRLSPTS